MECEIVHRGRCRDFLGFCRGKHAVIEAAILATRLDLLPAAEIQAEFDRLAPLVRKTGGPNERAAFALLLEYASSSFCKSTAPLDKLATRP